MGFWQESHQELFRLYKTRPEGLSEEEAKGRLAAFGQNTISTKKSVSFWQIFYGQFSDLLAMVLLVAGTLSFAFGQLRNALIIYIIVLVNALIGVTQEYKAEKILQALSKLLPPKAKALRNGRLAEIPVEKLVPGDVVLLETGDDVPADCRLLESYSLKVNEASLTGESHPQKKEAAFSLQREAPVRGSMVFMGTDIVIGDAKAVIVATGFRTELGKIASQAVAIAEELSPLQQKVRILSKRVALVAGLIMLVVVIYGQWKGERPLDSFLFALSLAAAAVPEGLPAALSVALSLGVSRLARQNALVRRLSAVESLGATTVICTDKTGTLTKNAMKVAEEYFPEHQEHKLHLIAGLCNNAHKDDGKVAGDPTEVALIEMLKDKGLDFMKLRQDYPRVHEYPFESGRKMMSVVVKNQVGDYLVFTKGAPQEILARCRLTLAQKQRLNQQVNKMAAKALRVLAFGWRQSLDFSRQHPPLESKIEQKLNFVGLVGLWDELRPEAPRAIDACHQAGIKVIIITGDYPLTAQAVAQKIHLAADGRAMKVITGEELTDISDLQLKEYLRQPIIFARASPTDKFRIVTCLKEMGEVVAVTGDGVNDAPALKRADIGVAMGVVGTDVARETADMVLLDDNFATIVYAIEEGRNIFLNIKKFVYYIFASNVGEFMTVVLGVLFRLPLPILAVQILAVDLGTDVLPSLSLGVDPASADVIREAPRPKNESLVDRLTVIRLVVVGVVMGLVAGLNFARLWLGGASYEVATTAAYASLVICQVPNVFACRQPNRPFWGINPFSNLWMLGAVASSLFLLWLVVYNPAFNRFLSTAALRASDWGWILLGGLLFFLVEEYRKFLVRKSQNRG